MTAIAAELVHKAREQAKAHGETPLAALERLSGLDGKAFLAALAEAFSFPALDMATGLLAVELRARVAVAAGHIRAGQPISEAMQQAGLTTPVAARLLRVGEKSGQMGEMMENLASFHDEETSRFVESFTRVFEPLLMAAIGLLVGLIVVLLYLPIFELAGSIE